MARKIFNLASGTLIFFLLLIVLFSLSRTSLRDSLGSTGTSLASAQSTPTNEAYLPIVSSTKNREDGLVGPSDSASIVKPNEIQSSKDVSPGEPEPFNLVPVPSASIPSFDRVSAELDNIKIETIARLEFTKGDNSFFGNVSWSPDLTRFVGEYTGLVEGRQIAQLYIGDIQTGKVSLWRKNGSFPAWNRDNNSIIYLRPRIDEPPLVMENGWSRSHYDLIAGSADDEKDELLLKDVIPPYFPLQQHAQTAQGNLFTLDSKHRLVVLPSPAELIEIAKQGVQPVPIADLSALVGIPEHAQIPMFDETEPGFSVSPDGSRAIIYRAAQPAYLIDIVGGKVEEQIDNIDTPHNVAWSTDGKSIAYTNLQGVFVYDVNTKTTNHLITSDNLGFAKEATRSGFSSPSWAFDNQVILFMVSSSDWVKPGTEDRLESYTMAATSNGKYWKAISDSDLISVSSTGTYAIVRSRSDSTTAVFELAKISR